MLIIVVVQTFHECLIISRHMFVKSRVICCCTDRSIWFLVKLILLQRTSLLTLNHCQSKQHWVLHTKLIHCPRKIFATTNVVSLTVQLVVVRFQSSSAFTTTKLFPCFVLVTEPGLLKATNIKGLLVGNS